MNNINHTTNTATNNTNCRRRSTRRDAIPSSLRNSCSVLETVKAHVDTRQTVSCRNLLRVTSIIDKDKTNETTEGGHFKFFSIAAPLKDISDDDDDDGNSINQNKSLVFDLSNLHTKDDLKRLHETDAFLYYSIPEVHKKCFDVSRDFIEDDDEDDAGDYKKNERIASSSPSSLSSSRSATQMKKKSALPRLTSCPSAKTINDNNVSNKNAGEEEDNSLTPLPPIKRRPSSKVRRNLSCPAGMLANLDISYSLFRGETPMVRRRHRISTESYPTWALGDDENGGCECDGNKGRNNDDSDDDEGEEDNLGSYALIGSIQKELEACFGGNLSEMMHLMDMDGDGDDLE